MTRPADFSLRYSFAEASVPPPYYYEYSISVQADGQGEAHFLPDYPQHYPVEKVTCFVVDAATLDTLYALVEGCGVFDKPTPAQDGQAVGGSQSMLEVWAGGWQYQSNTAIESIASALNCLLPEGFIERP